MCKRCGSKFLVQAGSKTGWWIGRILGKEKILPNMRGQSLSLRPVRMLLAEHPEHIVLDADVFTVSLLEFDTLDQARDYLRLSGIEVFEPAKSITC